MKVRCPWQRIRCGWHLAVGALIPWVNLQGAIGLAVFFVAYEYLQYKHHTRRLGNGESFKVYKDDSYLDVYEAAVALGVSVTVWLILTHFM